MGRWRRRPDTTSTTSPSPERLHAFGRRGQPPTPPLNLLGDFAGGSLYLAFGLVCGILEARRSGQGQIVDAAMVDGAASLMTAAVGAVAAGLATHERGTNHLDTGAHFYNVYECADGGWISVAPIEGKFYAELLRRLDIDPATMPPQMDRARWPEAQARLAALFKTRTRDQWCALLEGTDACFAPVLTTDEAPDHPHNAARRTYVEIDGIVQPAPAPRFSRDRSRPADPAAAERPRATPKPPSPPGSTRPRSPRSKPPARSADTALRAHPNDPPRHSREKREPMAARIERSSNHRRRAGPQPLAGLSAIRIVALRPNGGGRRRLARRLPPASHV